MFEQLRKGRTTKQRKIYDDTGTDDDDVALTHNKKAPKPAK